MSTKLRYEIGREEGEKVDNEEETSRTMAVLVAPEAFLPRGSTFGPSKRPEDFQELVFIILAMRSYREMFLFLDDLSVAIGRENAEFSGPTGAEDVIGITKEKRPRATRVAVRGPVGQLSALACFLETLHYRN